MGKRKAKREWLPWYRARDYKGNLTEAEKRQLDAFRTQPEHPAATYDQLPEEVQDYISQIQIDLYDHKQDQAASYAIVFSLIGAALIGFKYFGFPTPTNWWYAVGAFFLVAPWLVYRHQWRKNADEFHPRDPDAPNPTAEAFRMAWELDYIGRIRRQQRAGSDTTPRLANRDPQ